MSSLFILKRAAALFCLCLPLMGFAAEPGAVVDSFDAALADTMKHAGALGPRGRFERLGPAMEEHFDLAAMTRDITGSYWVHLSDEQKSRLIAAFTRFEVALFADWFDSATDQRFEVKDIVTRNDEIATVGVVLPRNPTPLRMEYVLRVAPSGVWRIVDVRYEGWMSTVEHRRSEFNYLLSHEGYDGLVARLEAKGGELLDHPDNTDAPHLQKSLRELWSFPLVPVY